MEYGSIVIEIDPDYCNKIGINSTCMLLLMICKS